jgi:hypothetical protein
MAGGDADPPLVDILLARIELIAGRMFALGVVPYYEPRMAQSFLVRARQRGTSALEALYDHLAEGDGSRSAGDLQHNDGTLDARDAQHPRALFGLADWGARLHASGHRHADALARSRGRTPCAGTTVEMMTPRARVAWAGRPRRIAPGMRGSEPHRPGTPVRGVPRLCDLPAGGALPAARRGLLGTWFRLLRGAGDLSPASGRRLVRFGSR